MKKVKITFTREVEKDTALAIALAKWYEINKQKIIKHTWVWETDEVIIEKNKETPEEFLAKYYAKPIDEDISKELFKLHMKEKEEQRKEEDKKLKEQIKEKVWETKIEIKEN